ncbi:MAG TPA: hypothetical protein VIV63_17640, partial [Steroidobacteraceae bacterium]
MADFSSRFIAVAVVATCVAAPAAADSPLGLNVLGTYSTGLGEASSEIAAYDKQSRRVFVTNAVSRSVDIVDVSTPAAPVRIERIDVSALGTPNSVSIKNGLVAVAIEAPVKTDAGLVAFYTADGTPIAQVRVGSQPDMLTFTPDGKNVVVANEGEPSGYGGATDVDPEGVVSIIRVPAVNGDWKNFGPGNLRQVVFTQYNGQEAALRAQGIRIYGPGASAAQDFEPEYVAVSDDSRTAYVTLQENNAIAVVDIARAQVRKLLPLGYKNYSEQPQTIASYEWRDLPVVGKTAAGQKINLGGFSGLAFEGTTLDGRLKFITHTDRGPNGEP